MDQDAGKNGNGDAAADEEKQVLVVLVLQEFFIDLQGLAHLGKKIYQADQLQIRDCLTADSLPVLEEDLHSGHEACHLRLAVEAACVAADAV